MVEWQAVIKQVVIAPIDYCGQSVTRNVLIVCVYFDVCRYANTAINSD
ncbi:hypothetical protein [Companilactobacillus kedongensis]|nr:hypothetical protein [Companilactobacillus kedongensis]